MTRPVDPDRRPCPRVQVEAEVKVHFEDFREFTTQYSRNMSETGMFLKTPHPKPPGTELRFELAVEGGTQLVRGTGEVIWGRDPEVARAEGRPPGMGIRFTSLDEQSRRLIGWVIQRRLAAEQAEE